MGGVIRKTGTYRTNKKFSKLKGKIKLWQII